MQTTLTPKEQKQVNDYLKSKGLPVDFAVTFQDVTLPEQYSEIRSRSEIHDFKTRLVSNIYLDMPICSANMESVTGADMAIALEREGGMGFIPQTIPIEERLEMIRKIKRTDSAFIDNPLTVSSFQTLRQAKEIMDKYKIYSLVVIDRNKKPVGILSTRDWLYETNLNVKVKDLMGGKDKLVVAPANIDFEKAAEIIKKNKIEKLPLVNKAGHLVGLITAHGLYYKNHNPRATRNNKGNFLIAGSIGVGKEFTSRHMQEVALQVKAGIDLLLIDTARAFSVNTKEALRAVKKKYPKLPVVVGNVSTPEGAKFLFENGADGIKVNQGRGHVCRTSEVGIGIPQLTAIAKASAIAKNYNGTVFADGGMKNAGDMVKAIAAGADIVFTGYLLVGSKESAAQLYFNKKGLPVKNYEGSASIASQSKRMAKGNLDHIRRPEGVTEEVVVTGTIQEIVNDLLDGFKSAMSYQGVRSLKELRQKTKFQLQTSAGSFEGLKK